MEYDYLYSGEICFFVNCKVTTEGLYYGFGYYGANASLVLKLYDEHRNPVILINTPDKVRLNNGIMNGFGDEDGPNFAERAMITI